MLLGFACATQSGFRTWLTILWVQNVTLANFVFDINYFLIADVCCFHNCRFLDENRKPQPRANWGRPMRSKGQLQHGDYSSQYC